MNFQRVLLRLCGAFCIFSYSFPFLLIAEGRKSHYYDQFAENTFIGVVVASAAVSTLSFVGGFNAKSKKKRGATPKNNRFWILLAGMLMVIALSMWMIAIASSQIRVGDHPERRGTAAKIELTNHWIETWVASTADAVRATGTAKAK